MISSLEDIQSGLRLDALIGRTQRSKYKQQLTSVIDNKLSNICLFLWCTHVASQLVDNFVKIGTHS